MIRPEIVEPCKEYFRSSQWKEVLSLVQERDVNHMHVYVDTCLDPATCLIPMFDRYFESIGWPSYRPIEVMADKPGRAALYGIHLEDKANFEIYVRFNPDMVLAPMEAAAGERGGNLRVWRVDDIRRFHDQFRWRDITAQEKQEVGRFLRDNGHWDKALEYVLDPDVMHVHCNIETNVHPNVIRELALADLDRRGFRIKHSIHSIFNGGGKDTGKIIFLGLDPARTFDIAYYYNSDVLIDVNTQETHMRGGEGTSNRFYVVRVSSLEQELRNQQLQLMKPEEMDHVAEAIAEYQRRSAYSWRIIPKDRIY